ncbi:beta-N-acetylhexosaminidase [Neptunicella marina]|uniref:beta-N-acetylhexosaminidase n=1 Tax=Neptunicella marina TaxID=2125989 RepID=A0A8J6IWZ3_9ALTE|nr:beta-N-acetylhexosaminidase [Neptunicella marina]MBC3767021.1 beta-N-acetylhexosaminidase [Neptunicella marina]
MMALSGYQISADEKELLEHPLVGGVYLDANNFFDIEQLSRLTYDIRSISRGDILIATSQEGGHTVNFKREFTPVPDMGRVYLKASGDLDIASDYAEKLGWLICAELLACNIDVNFAPLLDIATESAAIPSRAFHAKETIITQLAGCFINGMRSAGMKSCGKYYPGAGHVLKSSDKSQYVDKRVASMLTQGDMRVFTELHQAGMLDAVIAANASYPSVDKQDVSYSKIWLRQYLRLEMNFDGVVFSNDLSSSPLTKSESYLERAQNAMQAGCDMVLLCENQSAAIQVIDGLPIDYIASARLSRLLSHPEYTFHGLKQKEKWKQASQLAADLSKS